METDHNHSDHDHTDDTMPNDNDHNHDDGTNHEHDTESGMQPLLTVADFNGDGTVNNDDLDDLFDRIVDSNYHPLYDLNADSALTGADLDLAIASVGSNVSLLDQQIAQATQATMKYYGEGGLEQAIAEGYAPWTQEIGGHGIHLFNPFLANQIGNNTELVITQPIGLNYDAEGNLKAVFYIRLPKLLSGAIQDPLNPFVIQQELAQTGQVIVDPDDDFIPNSFDTLTEDDWHIHERAWIRGLGNTNSELVYYEDSLPLEDFNARILEKVENEQPLFPLSDELATPKFWMLHGWFHSLNSDGIFANIDPTLSINTVSDIGVHGDHGDHSDHDNHDNTDSSHSSDLTLGTDNPETMNGTTEDDRIASFNGDDQIFGLKGSDFIWGGYGSDLIEGGDREDEVYGGPDNDILRGNAGHDRIFGGTEDDQLFGDTGNDLLRGSLGNDTLTGGERIDYFILARGEGTDTITDFVVNVDKLLLANGLVVEALSINQSGENTLIEFNNETLAILNNVNASEIDSTLTFTYTQRGHHHDIPKTDLFRFQHSTDISKYLYVGAEEAESISLNYPEFVNQGRAFDVYSTGINPEENDTLMEIYRFRNKDSGNYIYVNDGERQAIHSNESLHNAFEEEGLAFYVYGATDHGNPIYRFRYLETNGYLYVGEAERQSINANYQGVIVEEGLAFYNI